jgi:hypothetical protein
MKVSKSAQRIGRHDLVKVREHDLVRVCRPSEKELELFEPWFRPRQESVEIKRTMTVPQLRKWHSYYEEWGCLSCKTKKTPHRALGFCLNCHLRVSQRLKVILQEEHHA